MKALPGKIDSSGLPEDDAEVVVVLGFFGAGFDGGAEEPYGF